MKRTLLVNALRVAVCGFGFAMVGADCQGNIVNDPTFRDWCGTSLCAWKTDYGQIARVPTWNAQDFGVSFLDDAKGSPPGTQISQASEESDATCIVFTSVGDIDPSAAMTISVDFDSDGSIDYSAPLGATSWHEVETEITAPPTYRGITFHVTKSGTGTAILAEMKITSTTGCTAKAPVIKDLALGEACGSAAACAQGLVCSQPDGGVQLCSQCSEESPCAGGASCAQRSVFLPFQCGLGQHLGATGAWCLANSDCASGACDGAKAVGLLSEDAGVCDFGAIGPDDTANCSWDGAIGGTCR